MRDFEQCDKCRFKDGSWVDCDSCVNGNNFEHKDKQAFLDILLEYHKGLKEVLPFIKDDEARILLNFYALLMDLYVDPDKEVSPSTIIAYQNELKRIIALVNSEFNQRLTIVMKKNIEVIKKMIQKEAKKHE